MWPEMRPPGGVGAACNSKPGLSRHAHPERIEKSRNRQLATSSA